MNTNVTQISLKIQQATKIWEKRDRGECRVKDGDKDEPNKGETQ